MEAATTLSNPPPTLRNSPLPAPVARRSGRDQEAAPSSKRRAFETEALPHLADLLGYALRLTGGDEARAEDLVQETVLRAYKAWDTFESGTNCRAWLMTILHNAFVSSYRSRKRRAQDVEYDEVAERSVFHELQESDPEGRFFHELVDEEVVRAIDELPDPYREALVLRDVHGLDGAEAARVMGVAEGTVKSRLHRARRILQRRLYDYAVDAGHVKPRGGRSPTAAGE